MLDEQMWRMIWTAFQQTLTMVLWSTLFSVILGFIPAVLLTLTAPLVDKSLTFHRVFFGHSRGFWLSDGLLFTWLRSTALSYILTALIAVLVFIIERRRIKGVSFGMKVLIALAWPIFLLIQLPIDVQAFFSRHLGWKPIPHKDKTSFEHVNPTDSDPVKE